MKIKLQKKKKKNREPSSSIFGGCRESLNIDKTEV